MTFKIRKASGKKVSFDESKLRKSLTKAGAGPDVIEIIVEQVKKEKPKSTKQLHDYSMHLLQKFKPSVAARYNLKKALMELGPAGYPFEKFIGAVFEAQGYKVQVAQTVSGKCVEHEVDVIAIKNEIHCMIECKFHNRSGLKTDVKVTLYIQARFADIRSKWEEDHEHGHLFHTGWVVTNTKFTSQAIQYGTCTNLKLLGWNYPESAGIAQMIDKSGLHPITSLPSLSRSQKRVLIKKGLVLCKDAKKFKNALKELGLSEQKTQELIEEANLTCTLQ